MTVTTTRENPRDPQFVHVNIRMEKPMADYLRDQADRGYLDVSKVVRRLIANDMRMQEAA